jgi:hypothetical protein
MTETGMVSIYNVLRMGDEHTVRCCRVLCFLIRSWASKAIDEYSMVSADVTHYLQHSISIGGVGAGSQNTWFDTS